MRKINVFENFFIINAFGFITPVFFGLISNGIDNFFWTSLLTALVLGAITVILFKNLLNNVDSPKNLFPKLVFYKIVVFCIAYIFLTHFNDGFYLHNGIGDDRVYFSLAQKFNSIRELLVYEKGFYGLPYAVLLVGFKKIFNFINLFRFFQLGVSVFTCFVFYKFLCNCFYDRRICRLGTILFGLNPMIAIFDSLLFKDTILVALFTLFFYFMTKERQNLKDYILIILLIIVTSFFRYFLVSIEFLFMFGIKIYSVKGVNSKIIINKPKKIIQIFSVVIFILIMTFLLKDRLQNLLFTFEYMDYRVENMTSLLSVDVEMSFSKLITVAFFFLHLPPPNLINYKTQWYVSEGLFAYPRVYNCFLGLMMYIGIFYKNNIVKIKINKHVFTFLIIVMITGMALTGQVLSDRHKLMVYPIVCFFAVLGIECIETMKFKRNLKPFYLVVFSALFVLQVAYSFVRMNLHHG